MSDTDSFIREVTEEVQQDRMFALWKKYGMFVLTAIVLVVAGTGAWSWLEHRERAARLDRGAEFIAAGADDIAALEALAAAQDGPARALAQLRLAQAQARAGERDAAVATYQAVAAMSGVARHYTDFARLEALRLGAATADPAETLTALGPLVAEGAPYRLLALELRAAVALNAGDANLARTDLLALMTDPRATAETRARAEALYSTLGGAASGS